MQSANQNRNIPSGSTVPMVQTIPVYKALQSQTVTQPSEKPSSVPIVTEAQTYKMLETQTTPGASLLPQPIGLTANVGGAGTYVNRGSATPSLLTQPPTYKPLASQINPGASIVPVFTQSQAIAPVANYINKDTTFWNTSQGGGGGAQTSTFSTLYASSLTGDSAVFSSITAYTASISTITNSTIITTSINIDGQLLDADSDQLFLNGIPIATTANLSSIQDWSLYDAISTVKMNNNNLAGAKNIQSEGISTVGIVTNTLNANSTFTQIISSSVAVTSSLGFYDALGYTLGAYQGTFVILDTGIVNATTVNAIDSVNTSSINTDTIYSYDLRLVSSIDGTGDGLLTVSGDGNTLFFNGSTIATGPPPTPVDLSQWATLPAVSTIQCISSGNALYTPGELNILGGSLNLETTAQLGNSTNSVLIADTGVRITGDNGIYLGANGGVQIGGLGGVSVSAVGGVAVSAGALFTVNVAGIVSLVAGGAINLAAIGAASLAATGPVNIGSVAYTSLEQIRINDSLITRDTPTAGRIKIQDVDQIQANNDGGGAGPLKLIGKDVGILVSTSYGLLMNAENNNAASNPIQIRTYGATGTGLGTTLYTMEQDFDPNTQSMTYVSGTQNISNILPPFNRNYKTTCYNVLSNSSTFNILSENYDGISTITYTNTSGLVNITGITNLTANTINATTLNIPNLTVSSIQVSSIIANNENISSIQVSSIVGNVGAFSTLLTNASTIRLGAQPGVGPALGTNSIGIGYNSQPFGINAIAIGSNAGNEGGANSISLGQGAGVLCGSNCINIGKGANGIFGGSGTITLNGTSSNLNPVANDSCYIKPLRNVSTQPGGTTFAMGYTNATGECVATNTKVSEIESTIQNTSQITYDTGLLTTTIDGILKINGSATATQSLTANTTFDSLQIANLSSLTLNGIPLSSFTNALQYNSTTKQVSYFPVTNIVAAPSFVYYVSKNGRVGASGSITDPLSTIAEALTKPANTGAVDPPGLVIYVAVGAYSEDITIPISLTLPSVSIIGMSNDTDDSKQVQIRGSVTVTGTDVTLVNTVNSVTLNNIAVFAKNGTTTPITMTGRGYRVYLQNGLYTTPFAMSVPLVALSSTGVSTNSVVQLVVNNCSMSMILGSSGNIISVASGQLFEIKDSDLTQRVSGLAVSVTGGTFSSANNSNFESTAGATVSLAFTVAGLGNFTNCLLRGLASPTVAILTCGTNANLNLSNCTIQNTNTVEANNTSRYVYLTAGVLVASIRNNFSSSATTPITQMTPYQGTTPASSALFYFANIYTNASNTVEENLPVWASVRQFSSDLLIPQFQVVATSATPIALNASVRGKTFLLTGTTTQPFTTTGLTATDAGLAVIVHNGNATGGGDINITGATGTTIVHNRTATANGGVLYLYWTGSALVGY